jgi:hypothetical protein
LRENQDEDLIMKQHKLHFTTWLKDVNLPVDETEEEKMIYLLTSGPHSCDTPSVTIVVAVIGQ